MSYTVISRPNCSWCDRAMDLLYEEGIPYEKVDLYKHMWVKTLFIGADLTTVPQVFDHNGVLIGGYEELVKHLEYQSGLTYD